MTAGGLRILERADFQSLLDSILRAGYRLLGPVLRDAAIVYDGIRSVPELPVGWTDEQEGGTYRLKRRGDAALFGYVVGPQSWKKYLFPPRERLWQADRTKKGFTVREESADGAPLAFLGVRSCELHAIAVQDRTFMPVDPLYRARREKALLVAVNCGQAAATCFCASMGTGPRATSGYDLALTEVLEPRHFFVVDAATERGKRILEGVPTKPASPQEEAEVPRAEARAAGQMKRSMSDGAREALARNPEHSRWDDVAARCLACANCTMVCPTCFCSSVEDVTDLGGDHAERWRSWDSCFTTDFSQLHGGSIRTSTRSRYRQWLTHKLSSWHDQFGTSGCVGCGRCITWCPVGIDLTEEVRAIAGTGGTHGDP